MSQTLVLDVLDALLPRLQGALFGVLVLDGQPVNVPAEPDVFVLGFNPETDSASQASRRAVEPSLTYDTDGRDVDVACLLSCSSGGLDFARLRERMRTILGQVVDLLATDRTLGGLVDEVEVGPDLSVRQAQSEDGAELVASLVLTARRY